MKFVRGKRTLTGNSGGEPSTWAMVILVGVIGFVVLMFNFGTFLRPYIPYGNSDYFWIGLIFLPMAALLVVATASKLIDLRRSASWSQAYGRIVKSEIEARRHRFGDDAEKLENAPAVEYEFEAGGRKIRGSRIGIGDDSGGENTEATLARYPVGATVTVYYDPDDPRDCVLERKGPKGLSLRGCLVPLAVLALFGGAIYELVTRGPDFITANFPHASNPAFAIVAACFGLALLLLFIGMRRASQRAARWPSVRGTVVKSGVESFQTRVGGAKGTLTTMYRPAVEFSYSVHGRDYRCNQIKLMAELSGTQDYAERVAAKYPAGQLVDVHYDPADPGKAALENPSGMAWILLVLALGSFALSLWQLGIFT
jgi:hypothetical protein